MDYIKQQTDYDGVSRWHAAGITGKGIVIWDAENGRADHGQLTRQRILDAAPDATVINASLSSRSGVKDAVLDDGARYTVEDFIRQYGVKIITRSVGGSFCGQSDAAYWQDLQQRYNLIILNSAGNDGSAGDTTKDPVAILVGACGLYKAGRDSWELRQDGYSSAGPGVDFVDFRGDISITSGTSFSTPYLAGKIALLCQRYGDITQTQAVGYLRSNAQGIRGDGRDDYSGWGLPLMGDLAEDYSKGDNKLKITFKIGSAIMDVDGQKIMMDEAPQYNQRGDRMMVPVKYVAEAFGFLTEWDEVAKTVRFTKR